MARGRRPDYVANLISGLQAEGLSGAEALRRLRETGHGVRTQTFYQLWGSTMRATEVRERLAAAPVFHVPEQSEIVRMPRPRATGYQYDVDVLGRDEASGALFFMPTSVVTPTLITHLEAIEQAVTGLQGAIAGGRPGVDYATVIGGGIVTGVIERVPEFDEPAE